MNKILNYIERKFPCRSEVIRNLLQYIGEANEVFPAALYIHGHSGTGKTAILKGILSWKKYIDGNLEEATKKVRTVHLNCIEAYTTKIFLESILEEISPREKFIESELGSLTSNNLCRCDNLTEFIDQLRSVNDSSNKTSPHGYILALDNAERLRDMDANILPSFLRLPELTGLNICAVLISQLPFEKFYCKTGLGEVICIHFPQYTKADILCILGEDLSNTKQILRSNLKDVHQSVASNNETIAELKLKMDVINTVTQDFYNNFLNLFLSVFYRACRDLPELRTTARKVFAIYMEPVLDGSIDITDVSRLWRHISGPLRMALAQVYMRCEQQQVQDVSNSEASINHGECSTNSSVRRLAQNLELPYYGKYLLIAAFLASYNSAKEDKRLYVKHHGKQRKRMQTVNAKAKVMEKMTTSLGPKSFTIDRLLAIFYAILEDKVGLSCNLLSQISTLVHLKLLSFVSGENNIMDGTARLQCTVGLEFILYIGKVVDFNVRQYLCDFM